MWGLRPHAPGVGLRLRCPAMGLRPAIRDGFPWPLTLLQAAGLQPRGARRPPTASQPCADAALNPASVEFGSVSMKSLSIFLLCATLFGVALGPLAPSRANAAVLATTLNGRNIVVEDGTQRLLSWIQ